MTDFESGLPGARLEVSRGTVERGDLVPDPFAGEIASIYAVRERGLVVISSCGHVEIINTVRRATGDRLPRLHAVVGSWHLAEAADDVISPTVDALVVARKPATAFEAPARKVAEHIDTHQALAGWSELDGRLTQVHYGHHSPAAPKCPPPLRIRPRRSAPSSHHRVTDCGLDVGCIE